MIGPIPCVRPDGQGAVMKVGSLFAGIGGLELGLERAGMEVIWQVEKDDYCRRVLAKHWPDVTRYEDVKDVGAHDLEPVDLICGGFPCQPVSVAGKRKAQDDERWLWPEFSRIIRELRPRFVLVENVPGLLVRGFGDVLGDLATLGYDAEWGCVSAASMGAPHLRERVFVIAHARGEGLEGQRSRWSTGNGRSQGVVADTQGQPERAGLCESGSGRQRWRRSSNGGGEVPDTLRPDCEPRTRGRGVRQGDPQQYGGHWSVVSRFCRMVDGFPTIPYGDQP